MNHKFCRDCVHCYKGFNAFECDKTKVETLDLVHGFTVIHRELCRTVRDDQHKCGGRGEWFKTYN